MASALSWIQVIFLGGIAGALGQAARTIVGIKKVNDQAVAAHADPQDLIVASRLFISLTIGFVAGALAALAMDVNVDAIAMAQILGLAGAGYAGADFIEGFINKTPLAGSPPAKSNTPAPDAEASAKSPEAKASAAQTPQDDHQG
jgi:uncharacterized membrane protein YeaQ/YmgE (transglycosylase-associated protein family)